MTVNTFSASLTALLAATSVLLGADEPLPLRVMQTLHGTHYAMHTEKPAKPAPTLFIIGGSIDSIVMNKSRYYTLAGDTLTKSGWIYVVLDPACEGYQIKPGDPSSLGGWAVHCKQGTDFMKPYVEHCRDVLDHLIAAGFTDPQRIAVQGISRGGFCALHFAAAEPRINAVIGIAPVTNPLALQEFVGVTAAQVAHVSLDQHLDKLAGRAVWMSIGNTDERVSTDDCISFARRLVATTRKLRPELTLVPVHLTVGTSLGHRAPDDAYPAAAAFLLGLMP
jgi:dienelactone hydrolase